MRTLGRQLRGWPRAPRSRGGLPAVRCSLAAATGLVVAAVVRIQVAGLGQALQCFLRREQPRRPWYSADGEEIGEIFEGGAGETPAYETVAIEMLSLPEGRIGVNILKGRRQVTRVLHREAFNAGWRIGDDVLEVNGQPVANNLAVRQAVKSAIEKHAEGGEPLRFLVRRWATRGTTRGMVRMTSPKGLDHMVPMLDLVRGLVQDYPVVLFMEGTLEEFEQLRGPSRQAVELLDGLHVAFKAVDCSDEKANPGIRAAVEEFTSDGILPKLYVGGKLVRDGLSDVSHLMRALEEAGAHFRAATPV